MSVKRNALSVSDKLEILRKHDENTTLNQKQLSESLGIPSSTLRTILKNRDSIATAGLGGCKRKKVKSGKHEDLEKIMVDWLRQSRNAAVPMSGPVIQEKAREIAGKLNFEFSASNGWLDRFKQRHGLIYRQISGESESVSENSVSEWQNKVLPHILSRYEPRDIFSADEFGLFFKLMPDKSYVFKGETCHGGKLSKERVTVLVTANSDGSEKLPLVVIGKSARPRCFKNVKNLPCVYKSQARAWMNGDLFVSWLKDLDNKMVRVGRKIFLFLNNCPAHPKNTELKNVEVIFLPPCSTSKLQPMDQGIIKVLKHFYRKRIVLRYLENIDSGVAKFITLLDAVTYISAAWEGIQSTTIANCFRKAGFNNGSNHSVAEVNSDTKDDDDWAAVEEKLGDVHMEDFVSVDDGIEISGNLELDSIVEEHARAVADENGGEEDELLEEPVPTRQEALVSMRVIRQFINASSDDMSSVNSHLNYVENAIVHCSSSRTRQIVIHDFFRKK